MTELLIDGFSWRASAHSAGVSRLADLVFLDLQVICKRRGARH
jgi:hypothetical protein